MKKKFLKAAFVMFLAALAFSCAKKSENIIIGTGQNYEPFCYRDADGNLAGFDIEVVREIDRRLPQYTFEFEVFEFKNVLVSLAAGKIDVGAHEFEENPERRKTYLYGEEGYNDYDSYLVVKADGPWSHITSLEELAGNPNAVLAASEGSNYEAFLITWNQTHPADQQLHYISFAEDYVRNVNMANGTTVAQILTQFEMEFTNARMPGLNLKIASKEPLIYSKAYFLFKKDGVALQKAFDSSLRDMKADGTLDGIKERILTAYLNSL
ncbi:MAG: transporter substrate-binding domain-containing protein [Spirochaetaceae bacterium]|jgi:L-cystine transport system substrate-binding protein|nr:transporter substrate-binding domain-containing protein [Spirochaetaceae bacterium]